MKTLTQIKQAWIIEGAVIAYKYALNENDLFFVICRNLIRHWDEKLS